MDTHALSVPAVAGALEVLAANGVEVMIAERVGSDTLLGQIVSMVAEAHCSRPSIQGLADKIADITLVRGDLRGIAKAIRLSRATMWNIRQNLFFAFL